ncbi:MAG: hypothetical protein GWP08_03355, partial [Nitrospiraceae bacterium]|nr:hypothetical protein [Nitrospiraceae bacterium]
PPPSVDQRKQFLDALRDSCSSLAKPETCFAHEWALIAGGQRAQAEALLELRRPRMPEPNPRIGDDARDTLHEAVVSLLRAEKEEGFLDDWSADELLALLRNWGAMIEPMPDGLENACLPLVCCAQFSGKTVFAFASAGGARSWGGWSYPASLLDDELAILSQHPARALSPPTRCEDGLWQVILAYPKDDEFHYIRLTCETQGTSVTAGTDVPPGGRRPEIDTASDPTVPSGWPAIQIWVPSE